MGIMRHVRNQWDRIGAWGCVAAGLIALLVGYFGVSGTLETGEQIPYVVSGGLVGLFLLGLGALLWLSADLRDEWRKLDAIDRHMVRAAPAGATQLKYEHVQEGAAESSPGLRAGRGRH